MLPGKVGKHLGPSRGFHFAHPGPMKVNQVRRLDPGVSEANPLGWVARKLSQYVRGINALKWRFGGVEAEPNRRAPRQA